MSLRLVTFDLDDTLWKTRETLRRAEQAMRRWLAFQQPRFLLLTRDDLQRIREQVIRANPKAAHDVSLLRLKLVEACLLQSGTTHARAAELAEGAFAEFLAWRNRVQLYEGARETVLAVRKKFIVASLTNGNAQVPQTPLKDCFDFSLSARDVGNAKPAPEMFLEAMKQAEVTPEETLHVGDHLEADIAAASRLGIRSVLVDHQRQSRVHQANATVHLLPQLKKLIESL